MVMLDLSGIVMVFWACHKGDRAAAAARCRESEAPGAPHTRLLSFLMQTAYTMSSIHAAVFETERFVKARRALLQLTTASTSVS